MKLSEKTTLAFSNVGVDAAKLTEGQQARVWLEEGSKDTAAKLDLKGVVPERWTVITGKVVSVAKDGTTITIEQPMTIRGGEPKRIEIKLSPKTKIAFNGVGPDEAKLVAGLEAMIRVLEGAKDTAAQATFSKPGTRVR